MKLCMFGLHVCFALFQVSETPVLLRRNFIVVSTRNISFLRGRPNVPTKFDVYTRNHLRLDAKRVQ